MIVRKYRYFAFILLFFLVSFGCSEKVEIKVIDLSEIEEVKADSEHSKDGLIRIAVGGMITPREGFAYYRKLLNYIGDKFDKEVEFIDEEEYSEINELLRTNAIDVAFVCGGPYVQGHEEFGMELLVAPYAYGGTVYYSYILVHKESPVENMDGLRGKTFAFTDPMSNSGKLVPTYMLARMNETPDSFFERYDYTYAHDKSIQAVAEGIVDGAAVDSLIWEYANSTNPVLTSRTKIIQRSPPHGIPPVVVRTGLDQSTKENLKQVFLNIHKDEKGMEILKGMKIDKFVPVDDSAYDSIREMKRWFSQEKVKDNKKG